MAAFYTESDYENALIELFESNLGYEYVCGYNVDHDVKSPLYNEILEESIFRINKGKPYDAIQNALLTLKDLDDFKYWIFSGSFGYYNDTEVQ